MEPGGIIDHFQLNAKITCFFKIKFNICDKIKYIIYLFLTILLNLSLKNDRVVRVFIMFATVSFDVA